MLKLILVIIFYFFCFNLKSGPLDIEDIKKKCLEEFQIENSDGYAKCIKEKVNKNLFDNINDE